MALNARLAAVLQGQAPKDEAERIKLANRAYGKTLHVASARLYAEAFMNDPKLADDRGEVQHRYNAACAAALAGSGEGKDDPPPDDAAKARLRRQAREWLRSELAAWTKVLDGGPAEMKAKIAPILQHWKDDTDLAGIRDEKGLAKLPEEERAAFKQLWTDVDRLLARAAGTVSPRTGTPGATGFSRRGRPFPPHPSWERTTTFSPPVRSRSTARPSSFGPPRRSVRIEADLLTVLI